jgi:opacity protein-like surface antigen
MKPSIWSAVLIFSLAAVYPVAAQSVTSNEGRRELGVSIGELSSGAPNAAGGQLDLNAGIAIELSFAQKIRDFGFGSLYWEVDSLVGPLRRVDGTPLTATHTVRSIYATPGLRLRFTPKEPVSPWLAAGAGYAFYNSDNTAIDGGPAAGGSKHTYAIDVGGGVDYALGKSYVLRGEARGFYTGSPRFGTPSDNGLFNFVVSGGLVWRFK